MAGGGDARFAKPLDLQTLEFFARNVNVILTREAHALMGGFGSVMLEALSDLGISKPAKELLTR